MTEVEAAKLIAVLVASFPDAKWTDATRMAYESAIVELEHGPTQQALRRLIATTKFRPAIAEVLAAVADVAHGEQRKGADAWGDVVYAVRYVGSYRNPAFRDPIVAHVVAQLGWSNICLEGGSDAPLRARFCEAYDAAASAERREVLASPARLRALPPVVAADGRQLPKAWADDDIDRTPRAGRPPELVGKAAE